MAFTGASPNLTATITRAGLPLQALNGVRRRRLVAVTADLVLVSIVVVVLWTALLVLTFGLSLVLLPPLFPVVAFFYNGLSVSGHSMATPGMRLAGIQLRMDATGDRVPFINAALHAVSFYFSWMFPPVLLLSLFTEDKRCLHDMLSGVIVVRRW